MRKITEVAKQLNQAEQSITEAQSILASLIDKVLTREELNTLELAIDHTARRLVKVEVQYSTFRGIHNAVSRNIFIQKFREKVEDK